MRIYVLIFRIDKQEVLAKRKILTKRPHFDYLAVGFCAGAVAAGPSERLTDIYPI